MTTSEGIWLCPLCEATERTCRLCDGCGFLTELEMSIYEKSSREKMKRKAQNNSPGVLTLDLSEFEQE